jgi:hypothetical protein
VVRSGSYKKKKYRTRSIGLGGSVQERCISTYPWHTRTRCIRVRCSHGFANHTPYHPPYPRCGLHPCHTLEPSTPPVSKPWNAPTGIVKCSSAVSGIKITQDGEACPSQCTSEIVYLDNKDKGLTILLIGSILKICSCLVVPVRSGYKKKLPCIRHPLKPRSIAADIELQCTATYPWIRVRTV